MYISFVSNGDYSNSSTITNRCKVINSYLKNISQNGNLPQIGVKLENMWNHHLAFLSGAFATKNQHKQAFFTTFVEKAGTFNFELQELCMDYVWICMEVCMYMYGYAGYVWICMDMYGYVWICMDMYGYVWICRICMWFEEHPFAWFTCAFRWVASQIRLNDRIDSPRHSRRFKNLYRTNTTLQANSPLKSAICLTSFLSFNQPSESLGRFKDRIWNKNIRESWAVVMNFSNIAIGEAPKESDCIRKFDCSVVFALVFSLGSLHLPNVRWKSHIKI